MKLTARVLWTAVLLLAGVTGCSNGGGQDGSNGDGRDGLPVVKVAINTWPGLGPFYVASEKGFDREEGVKLEVVMTEDTVARRSSLAAGEVDLVGITLDTVIIAHSRGVPMVVVGESDFSHGGDGIIAKKEIQTVADLKGKRVACTEGLPSHFFLLHLLDQNDLGPDDIELVPADDGGQASLLFTSGRVDAAVTWDPWISRAESLTEGHVLITTKDAPGLILGIVAAHKERLPDRADAIYRVQKAWFKAVEYCQDHPDEAAEIMAKQYNVPVDKFKQMAKGAKLADRAEMLKTFGTREQPGPIRQLAEDANKLWMKAGVIEKPVRPEDVIDWTIVERVRGERE